MTDSIQELIGKLERAFDTGIIMEREAVELRDALGLEDAYDSDWKQCCWNALKGSADAGQALANELFPNHAQSVTGNEAAGYVAFLSRPGAVPTGARKQFRLPGIALVVAILMVRRIQPEARV